MVKLAAYAEFKTMLDRAAEVEDELLTNELEMLHSQYVESDVAKMTPRTMALFDA